MDADFEEWRQGFFPVHDAIQPQAGESARAYLARLVAFADGLADDDLGHLFEHLEALVDSSWGEVETDFEAALAGHASLRKAVSFCGFRDTAVHRRIMTYVGPDEDLGD